MYDNDDDDQKLESKRNTGYTRYLASSIFDYRKFLLVENYFIPILQKVHSSIRNFPALKRDGYKILYPEVLLTEFHHCR